MPVRTIALDQAVQSIVDKMPEAEKQMREEVIKERQASKARAPEPEVRVSRVQLLTCTLRLL